MKTVALLGAHTAVAKSLVECADDLDLPVDWIRATSTAHVGPGLVLMDPTILERAEAYVLCFDDPITRALARSGRREPVLDLADVSEGAPLASPGMGGVMRIAAGPQEPVSAVTTAFAAGRPREARLVSLESAAVFGEPGIEALSSQTRAVFTMRPETPSLLPELMAFSMLAAIGADEEQSARAEQTLERDLRAATGIERWDVTRALAPTFSSEMFVLDLTLEDPSVKPDLEGARALRPASSPWMPSQEAVGRDDVMLKVQRRAWGVRAVGAYDRLRRGSATQAAWWLSLWASPE